MYYIQRTEKKKKRRCIPGWRFVLVASKIFLLTHSSGFFENTIFTQAFLVVQTVKIPPAMQEARMQSLGQEDPLA